MMPPKGALYTKGIGEQTMIKAVIFDLDGTLTDTLADIGNAMNHTLAEHGLPTYDLDRYRYLVGSGMKRLARLAVGDRQDMYEPVLAGYAAYYARHATDTTAPYPGVVEMLGALHARGLKLCVFSNKPHGDVVTVVQRYLPEIPFALVQGQIESVPVKPDPAGALRCAAALGVAPDECLYLGDTDVDMLCARNAGMHPIGVKWGFRPEELAAAGAEAIIEEPMEIMAHLA